MKKILFFVAIFIVVSGEALAQLSLTNAAPTATINFSNSMQTSVGTNGSTAFTGAGFAPNPTSASMPGRLNSNAWETKGWSNGNLLFGQAMTNPAHGRGSVSSAVLTEGIYAYTDNPASVANPTLMIQPGDGDFAPGSLTLRIRNNGTTNMTQLQVSYNLFVRNDENGSSSFNFSHSMDNVVFEEEAAMDYTSPEAADLFQWTMVDIAPSRTMVISGINVAPGGYYYIRWSSADVVVNGGRDEFGLDDIVVTAFYGSPAPEINVVGNTLTIVNNDTSPSSADGTIMANAYTGGSNSLITYTIQNLGGADLNITNVTITGTNGADFTIQGSPPIGTIPGVTSVVNVAYLTVKFTPSAPGDRIADIRIYSNDSNENPYFFRIKGTGVIPQPDIEVLGNTAPNTGVVYTNYFFPPSTSNGTLFDPQQLGGAGQTKEFKIRNTGAGANLVLGPDPAITITGAHPSDFTLVAVPTNNTINPGYFQTFQIKFNPTAAGIRTAIVTIQNNDVVNDVFNNDESPFVFLVQGNGVSPEADVSGNGQPIADGSTTTALSNHTFFDSVNINAAFVDRTFTITNSGTMALTVGTPVITGSTAFSVISAPGTTVAAGASTTFIVRFDPFAIGTVNATVTFSNNDADENPYSFAISGYGLDYVPCSTLPVEIIAHQDFEATPPAQNWTYAFAGTNMGLTTAAAVAYATSTDGGTSERFLGARAAQLINNATGGTITFASVSTMDFYNVEMTMRLASMSATSIEGTDAADKAIIAISTNGGTSWSNEVEVRGFNQSKWSFTSGTGTASVAYDGNNGAAIFAPVVNGYVTDQGYSTISITNLPMTTQLRVRVTLNSNSNEIWVVDDVTLFGRREIETTWDGSAWSNGTPTPSVKAIINGNYDTAVSGNLSACKCEITAGKTVTIQPNQHFSIESDLENLGVINIENGGSLVQRNDFATNAGVINVKRASTPMKLYDYTYWSSPVQGQTLFNLSPLTPSDKFWHFNSSINNWQGVPSSTIMAPAKGYIVRAPQTFNTTTGQVFNAQFSGLTNNGFIQTPVVGGGAWNLLGNPYPSAIDADEFLSFGANVGVLGGTLYFWTHNTPIANNAYNGNDYASYNLTGGVGTQASTPGNTSIPTGMIASGQGFFVAGLTNGQATFNNSMRAAGSNLGFFRPANQLVAATPSSGSIEKHRIWLDLANSQGAFKQTLVGYIQGATNLNDRDFDGLQLNGGNALGFYSILGEDHLAIQGRALPFDDGDTVPLGLSVTNSGEYTISIDRTDGIFDQQGIYLQDNDLGIVHDLQASPYVFTIASGTFNNRFVLRYTDAALSVGDQHLESGLQLAVREHKVHFRASNEINQIEVYDLMGRRVLSQKVSGNEGAVSGLRVSQSYIVKVYFADGTVANRKIMFN